jgi:hypothetical protein
MFDTRWHAIFDAPALHFKVHSKVQGKPASMKRTEAFAAKEPSRGEW